MSRRLPLLLAGLAAIAAASCGGPGVPSRPATDAALPPVVAFLGDSLTAGYGVGEALAFPALVGERLRTDGTAVEVVNAGVSGDTTADGLRRLDRFLAARPDVVVVGLGANDGLRGVPVDEIEENLRRILTRVRQGGAAPLLLGMRVPPMMGTRYSRRFEEVYERLADDLDVPLVPFMLDGVAGRPALNLEDRLHPNAAGHRRIAENVAPALERLLRRR